MTIADNTDRVMSRIRQAAESANRATDQVTLLAVSKGQPVQAIEEAYRAGCRQFGENYLQDALRKIAKLSHLSDIQWHFIGPLQSNKTRKAAENFDWVHSIDRLKVAARLNAHRPPGLKPLNVCLQVNIDAEESKSGAMPEQLLDLAMGVSDLPRLKLRGLMTIPRPRDTDAEQRQPFARVCSLFNQLRREHPKLSPMDTLSMGMSRDLEAAILEGSTLVRVGTDIFGPRITTPVN